MDCFWKWYLRGLALVGLGGVAALFASVAFNREQAGWSPQAIALITAIVGGIVPITTAVANWAKLQLEAQRDRAKVLLEERQMQHTMTGDYLKMALDPTKGGAERQLVLNFLATPGVGEEKLREWAADERRLNMQRLANEQKALQSELPKAPPALRPEIQRRISANDNALPPPPKPPVTRENLLAGIVNELDLGALNCPGENWDKVAMYGKRFPNSNFRGASIRGALLAECDASGTDFTAANLTGSYLDSGAKFVGAKFEGAKLVATRFRGSDVRLASFRGADLAGADLSGCNLQGADFREAKLNGHPPEEPMVLGDPTKRCKFVGAMYDATTKWPASDFDPKKEGCIPLTDPSLVQPGKA